MIQNDTKTQEDTDRTPASGFGRLVSIIRRTDEQTAVTTRSAPNTLPKTPGALLGLVTRYETAAAKAPSKDWGDRA